MPAVTREHGFNAASLYPPTQGGTLSMGEIMARMSDAKQLALQRTERDLCDHLNALAACLTAAAGALIALPLPP